MVGGIAVTSTSVFSEVMKNQINGSRLKQTIISVARKNKNFGIALIITAFTLIRISFSPE